MKAYRNEEGELHRVDGPAIEWRDVDEWCYNGRRHRYYGPAKSWRWKGEDEYFIFGEKVK